MDTSEENQSVTKKKPRWKRWLKYSYLTILHLLAAASCFFIFTALAVKFKWTNETGAVDVNNRYYQGMADVYGKEAKKDSAEIARDECLMFQKIGVLSRFYPKNAKIILEAYQQNKNVVSAMRMLDAVEVQLKDNKEYIDAIKAVKSPKNTKGESLFAWSNYKAWKQFCQTLAKDKKAIDSVSRLTGVESRIIILCVIAEQLRMFNSGREKFKQYVYPYTRLILPTNRGYGVSGILEHTALRIENTLFRPKDPFYPGDYFKKIINIRDSFPDRVNDTISAHRHKTIQRLIQGGDHYYSYLYTALLLREFQAHWESKGFTLANRPEVLGTLFNLGYQKSKPKIDPQVGGSTFKVGDRKYTFGGICFEFYYSGELQKEFPITGRGFIPVKELEIINKPLIERINKRIKEADKKRAAAAKKRQAEEKAKENI